MSEFVNVLLGDMFRYPPVTCLSVLRFDIIPESAVSVNIMLSVASEIAL